MTTGSKTAQNSEPMLEFGEYLGDLLSQRKLKATDLAHLLALDESTVQKWVSGGRVPDFDNERVKQVLSVLDLNPAECERLFKTLKFSLHNQDLKRKKWLSRDERKRLREEFWRVVKILVPAALIERAKHKAKAAQELPIRDLTTIPPKLRGTSIRRYVQHAAETLNQPSWDQSANKKIFELVVHLWQKEADPHLVISEYNTEKRPYRLRATNPEIKSLESMHQLKPFTVIDIWDVGGPSISASVVYAFPPRTKAPLSARSTVRSFEEVGRTKFSMDVLTRASIQCQNAPIPYGQYLAYINTDVFWPLGQNEPPLTRIYFVATTFIRERGIQITVEATIGELRPVLLGYTHHCDPADANDLLKDESYAVLVYAGK